MTLLDFLIPALLGGAIVALFALIQRAREDDDDDYTGDQF